MLLENKDKGGLHHITLGGDGGKNDDAKNDDDGYDHDKHNHGTNVILMTEMAVAMVKMT